MPHVDHKYIEAVLKNDNILKGVNFTATSLKKTFFEILQTKIFFFVI